MVCFKCVWWWNVLQQILNINAFGVLIYEPLSFWYYFFYLVFRR